MKIMIGSFTLITKVRSNFWSLDPEICIDKKLPNVQIIKNTFVQRGVIITNNDERGTTKNQIANDSESDQLSHVNFKQKPTGCNS